MNDSAVYLTADGLQKAKAELEHMKTVTRADLAERLASAIAMGDLKENADYHYAKQEQAFIEGKIKELEETVRNAVLIDENVKTDHVRVGCTVTIVEDGTDYEEIYRIVGQKEADPANGLISNESPMGKALIGAKVGQKVQVSSPGGLIPFNVVKIE